MSKSKHPVDTVSMPVCFGEPERVDACTACGVRAECYAQHTEESVFLLPFDRPAARMGVQEGAREVDAEFKKLQDSTDETVQKGTTD